MCMQCLSSKPASKDDSEPELHCKRRKEVRHLFLDESMSKEKLMHYGNYIIMDTCESKGIQIE